MFREARFSRPSNSSTALLVAQSASPTCSSSPASPLLSPCFTPKSVLQTSHLLYTRTSYSHPQLAALDWTPWPTRIEPVDPKKKERGPSRIPSSDAMQIKPKPFEPDGLAFSRTPSAKKESRTQTPEKHDTSHTQDHHLVTPPPPARAPSDPLQLQAKKPPADN